MIRGKRDASLPDGEDDWCSNGKGKVGGLKEKRSEAILNHGVHRRCPKGREEKYVLKPRLSDCCRDGAMLGLATHRSWILSLYRAGGFWFQGRFWRGTVPLCQDIVVAHHR